MKDKFASLSDNELIALLHSGNRAAANELIARYLPLIRHKASGYRLPGMEPDDIVQEGMLGLLKAISFYQPQRSSFATFASICISSSLSTAVKAALSLKSLPLNNYAPLIDDGEFFSQLIAEDPQQQLAAQEQVAELLRKIDTVLSLFEQQTLKLYLSGLTYTEISSSLSTTPKAVDNALQRVRRKLRTVDEAVRNTVISWNTSGCK